MSTPKKRKADEDDDHSIPSASSSDNSPQHVRQSQSNDEVSNGVQTPKKKVKTDSASVLPTPPMSGDYSSTAMRMMSKMGYDESRGLGRNAQGPTQIVEESKQKGRRGLGFAFQGFTDEKADWNFDDDPAPVEEEVHWCPSGAHSEVPLDLDEMRGWIQIGPKKRVIDDEIEFCDEEILQAMLLGKTVFDELPQKEMEEARARSNVYEIIGQSIFLNRAAVKMANIDAVFERMFTEPKTPDNQRSLVHSDEPFYFADICAGPGGFSEYVLWKKQWRAKGFGFTLKGDCDFKPQKFRVGPPEMFDRYYGVNGMDGDGDIFKSANIDALKDYVHKGTMGRGVHMVMADGGFSVEGQENIQEILSKQLYLCQFLTALTILRPGGHFVCKLFDVFTPFSVGLVYLMYRTFHHVALHKPVTSRPANSERYIICKGLRGSVRDIVRPYMYEINVLQNQHNVETDPDDVQSIVPIDILKGNQAFYDYIRTSNDQLGEHQIRNLKKIRAFVSNASLQDIRQHEIRTQCLQYWELPNEPRQNQRRLYPKELQADLFYRLGPGIDNLLLNMPNPFKNAVLQQHRLQSLFDYRCVLSLGEPILLISCGRNSVFGRPLKSRSRQWLPMETMSCKIELPPYTLALAERVQEHFLDSRKNSRRRWAVYIIDVYFLGNENMLVHHSRPAVFMDRYHSLKLFEKTINKPASIDLVPIRISEPLRLEQMDDYFKKLCPSGELEQIDADNLWFTQTDVDGQPRVPVQGLWIIRFVQDPWTMLLSKSHKKKYFHNAKTGDSLFEPPSDASHVASLKSMLESSFYWDFENRDDPVRRSAFVAFIQSKNHDLQAPQGHSTHSTATGSH